MTTRINLDLDIKRRDDLMIRRIVVLAEQLTTPRVDTMDQMTAIQVGLMYWNGGTLSLPL